MGFWSGVRDGFVGSAKGTWDGVKGLAKGGYDLATDPAARERAWEATKSAGNAVADYAEDSWNDPTKPFRDARDGANAAYNAADKFVRTADAEDWGKLAGAGVFEVGTALVPVGAVAKAGKLGKLGKLGRVANAADKIEGAVDNATDAAKLLKNTKAGAVAKCAPTKLKLCFSGDTLVEVGDTKIPIREIQIGDSVRAYDTEAGSWEYSTVTRKQVNVYRGPFLKLHAGSSVIEVTAGHPFWVVAGAALENRPRARALPEQANTVSGLKGCWIDSHDLMAGDQLITSSHELITIERIEQYVEDSIEVFNLEVANFHTFCVGEDGILAHNGDSWCDIFAKARGMTQKQLAEKRKAVADAWGVDVGRTHGHHLVHKVGFKDVRGPKNKLSQDILDEFGIDIARDHKTAKKLIDDGDKIDNLIIAPYEYVHSEEYVNAVYKRLQAAKENALKNLKPGQTLKDRPEFGTDALREMRELIEDGNKL